MGPTSMLTYTAVKTFLFGQLYSPSTWHNVSWILGAAYERNATLLTDLLLAQPPPITASSGGQAEQGIRCSDKVPRMDSLQAFLPLVDELEATSTMVGDLVVQMQATCLQWKMPAVETYKGDFQTKTRNPILFVSNEFDPVTPLMSAQNMSAGFEGSRLLVNKGGHGVSVSYLPSKLSKMLIRSSIPHRNKCRYASYFMPPATSRTAPCQSLALCASLLQHCLETLRLARSNKWLSKPLVEPSVQALVCNAPISLFCAVASWKWSWRLSCVNTQHISACRQVVNQSKLYGIFAHHVNFSSTSFTSSFVPQIKPDLSSISIMGLARISFPY